MMTLTRQQLNVDYFSAITFPHSDKKNGRNAAKMFFLVLFAVTISYNDLIWEEVAGS